MTATQPAVGPPPSGPQADPYWQRLVEGHLRLSAAGVSHPDVSCTDPELVERLTAPTATEADYVAPDVGTHDVDVAHASGRCQARVYRPHGPTRPDRPVFVWAHGGGWAAGDLDGPEADATAREVSAGADAVVVSVDYRLAVQGTHYPVPLDDVVACFLWTVENAAELGADPRTITLGGASAGANLAAGTALRLRDAGAPAPRGLALVYPTLHPVLPPASAELRALLDRITPAMAFAAHLYRPIVENYLGADAAQADAYAMPGTCEDLAGLPPTLIVNCEYDGLRASGEHFASQLHDAGVAVTQLLVPGVEHGHLARPGLPAARNTHQDLVTFVKKASTP